MSGGGRLETAEPASSDRSLPSEWPEGGVETLGSCPVCNSPERELFLEALRDRIFFCSPGAWDLYLCGDCGSGYLDPRPTPDTIHLAYRDYYTHEAPEHLPAGRLAGLRWVQRVLANGYKNWRFGTDLQPSSVLGVPVAFLFPPQRAILDRQFRHLKPRSGGGRVLDIGFGDGDFLDNARHMGWQAVGTDFDPVVVENARKRGLDARLGTVDDIEGPFDVITMSHVIEHLHDPVAVVRRCYDLLAPGGALWIETPNIEAQGLRQFGRHWRGLEPPRHLVLFNRESLARVFREAGFNRIRDLPQPSPVRGMWLMSRQIEAGRDPYEAAPEPISLKLEMAATKLFQWVWKPRREFLAMMAWKV